MAKIKYPKKLPAQHQQKPGIEEKMHPKPKYSLSLIHISEPTRPY